MQTTIDLDEKLMQDVMKTTGLTDKSGIINKALKEFLYKATVEGIKNACGKLHFDIDIRAFRDLELDEVQEWAI